MNYFDIDISNFQSTMLLGVEGSFSASLRHMIDIKA